ncbi:MAG TPA: hypothetical protein VIK89_11825, partial [Cytophagaceae bacterium]
LPEMSQDLINSFDEKAKIELDTQMAEHLAKADEEKIKMEEDSAKERLETDNKIKEETEKTAKLQKAEQDKAKKEVGTQRENWKKENEKLQSDFKTEAEAKQKETQGKIETEVSTTETKVEAELSKAEKEAKDAEVKAKQEAEQKKEAERKRPKSFWQKVGNAVSKVFDKIKAALNAIFDKLRAFVKKVIEAAKKLVNGLIDLARKAIIGLIKAFGELLKKMVSVLLAAFPALRDKIIGLIDKAVNYACEMVNKLAEALKKAVNFLLDALGKALDAILAFYQKMYNLILAAMKFIAAGLIRIIEGISNIIESIGYALDSISGALVKEFVGEDVTSPLPNVEATEAELPELISLQKKYAEFKAPSAEAVPAPEPDVNGLAEKETLQDSEFVMDPAGGITLDSELIANLPSLKDGETLEMGGSSNPVTAKDLSEAVYGGGQTNETTTNTNTTSESPVEEITAEGPVITDSTGRQVDLTWLAKSDDEKLQYQLDQMGADTEMPNPKEKSGGAAEDVKMPVETKTGRLGVGKRLSFIGSQMMKGLSMWWNENKVLIYTIMIGVLIGTGIIAFFSGGAGVIGLLQLFLKAVSAWFIAEAIMKIKGHLFDWLEKAWNGDPQGGGQSLAQALAVLFSEFLFEYVLKGIGKVLKRIKNSLKATKAARKISKGVNKATSAVKKGVHKVTKPLHGVTSQGGKYVLKIKQGFGKGIKRLEDFRERVLAKFGFDRMWMERHGEWIEIWAEFNPKILIVKQKLDKDGNSSMSFSTKKVTPTHKAKIPDDTKKIIGHKTSNNGVIVSDGYVKHLEDLKKSDPARFQEELLNLKKDLDAEDFDSLRERVMKGSPKKDKEVIDTLTDKDKVDNIVKEGDGVVKKPAGQEILDNAPENGTLSDLDTRKWYLEQESKISELIDKSQTLEEQARQAFELRNKFRTKARELMADREKAAKLMKEEPNMTWEQILEKYKSQGYEGDALYNKIITSSQKSRKSVNDSLGLNTPKVDDTPKVDTKPKVDATPKVEPTVIIDDPVKKLPPSVQQSVTRLENAGLKVKKESNTIRFLDDEGNVLAEIENGALRFKYEGFGGDVIMDPDRMTTVLGKFFEDINNPKLGTRHFLGTDKPPVKVKGLPEGSFSRGEGKVGKPNDMNFLDIKEAEYNAL